MKRLSLILAIILFWLTPAFATTYYVDSAVTDTNVGSATCDFTTYNPTTFSTSTGSDCVFKTIADINAALFSAGDSILFKKGDTWREQLTVPSSGSAGNHVTFGAYGSGALPIINGANIDKTSEGDWTADVVETGGLAIVNAETGDETQFISTVETGGTIAATTESKNNGAYGFTVTGNGVVTDGYGIKTFTLGSPYDVYIRCYVYVPAGTSLGTTGTARGVDILQIYYSTTLLANIYLYQTAGASAVDQIGAQNQRPFNGGTNASLSTNAWHYVELEYRGDNASTGGWAWWVDGSLQNSNFALNTATYRASSFRVGQTGIRTNAGVLANAAKLYFDDIKVDTSAIGAYSAAGVTNVWHAAVSTESQLVSIDDVIGAKKTILGDLASQGDWIWSGSNLYVYATSNPATAYTSPGVEYTQRRGINSAEKTNLIFDSLEITKTNDYGIFTSTGAANVIIQNSAMNWNALDGIRIGNSSNVSVLNNTIHDNGFSLTQQGNGILYDTVVGGLISENTVSNSGTYNITLYGVTTDVVIEHNTASGSGTSHQSYGSGIGFYTGGATPQTGNIARFNYVYDDWNNNFFLSDASTGTEVYYNIFSNPGVRGSSGFSIYIGNVAPGSVPTGTLIENNVMYIGNVNRDNVNHIRETDADRKLEGAIIKNNIFYTGNSSASGQTYYSSATHDTAPVLNYNLHYGPNLPADSLVKWENNAVSSFATLQGTYGQELNGINADPLFVSTVTPDFHLQATSPARAAGVYVGLLRDFAGNTVPVVPDIGAYQLLIPGGPFEGPFDSPFGGGF